MSSNKKIYFASDFHLGAPNAEASLARERKVVNWLNDIAPTAREIFLLGDIFDFWFEYKHAVPKGYVRLLGKLAEITDSGIPLHIFTGNHDLWMRDYLKKELNAHVHYKPVIREIDGKRFYIAHGDGLGPGDKGFKFIKKIFTNPTAQWLFERIHPNTGIGMAHYFSRTSRAHTGEKDANFMGEENEWLIIHSKEILTQQHIDYFIYGHRHYPLMLELPGKSMYTNLGDWINYFSYAEWNGETLALKYYRPQIKT